MKNHINPKDVVPGAVYWCCNNADYNKPEVRSLVKIERVVTGVRGEARAICQDIFTEDIDAIFDPYSWFEAVDQEYFAREIKFAAEAIARQTQRILILQKFVTNQKVVTN